MSPGASVQLQVWTSAKLRRGAVCRAGYRRLYRTERTSTSRMWDGAKCLVSGSTREEACNDKFRESTG